MCQENYYRTWQKSQRTEKGKQWGTERYKRSKNEKQGEATGDIFKEMSDKTQFRKIPGSEPWEEKQLIWCICTVHYIVI